MNKVNQKIYEGLVEGQRMHMHVFVTNELADSNSELNKVAGVTNHSEDAVSGNLALSEQPQRLKVCKCPGTKVLPRQTICQECGQKTGLAPLFNSTLFQDKSILDSKGNISNHALRQILNIGSQDGIWPPIKVRNALQGLYDKFSIKPSSIQGIGTGLFAFKNYKKGDIVGVYGGHFGDHVSDYILTLGNKKYDGKWGSCRVEGTPTGAKDFTIFGYINDYIWRDKDGNNTIFEHDGAIMATTGINKGQEFFISYGSAYDWSEVRTHILHRACEAIITTAKWLCFSPSREENIRLLCDKFLALSSNELIYGPATFISEALKAVIMGSARDPCLLHGYAVYDYGQTNEDLLIQIILCEMFYNRTAFNEIGSTKPFDTEWLQLTVSGKITKSGRELRSTPAVNYDPDRTTLFVGLAKNEYGLAQVIKNFKLRAACQIDDFDLSPEVDSFYQNTGEAETSVIDNHPDEEVCDMEIDSGSPSSGSTEVATKLCGATQGEEALDMELDSISPSSHSSSPPSPTSDNTSTVKLACYNCGGITVDKWKLIVAWMTHNGIELLSLIDTRHNDKIIPTLNMWLRMLGGDSKLLIKSIPIVKTKSSDAGIGGQIILYTTRIECFAFKCVIEEGALVEMLFRLGRTNYRVLSTYWPGNAVMKKRNDLEEDEDELRESPEKNAGALLAKLKRYYNYPLAMIKERIKASVEDRHVSVNLVMGDFNSDINKKENTL
jgi:hypothetical protein